VVCDREFAKERRSLSEIEQEVEAVVNLETKTERQCIDQGADHFTVPQSVLCCVGVTTYFGLSSVENIVLLLYHSGMYCLQDSNTKPII
jgi:hypothetical protein